MNGMILYHTGFAVIEHPELRFGRKNADFGQGFYLTADADFAHRWARERKGQKTIINTYALDCTGLQLHSFRRDAEWFAYLYANRNQEPDPLTADVIIGPIANDTIYDTWGIITSGFLKPEAAMRLLLLGPEYQQIAVKTEKAAAQLQWLSSQELSPEEIAGYRALVAEEEDAYQKLFVKELEQLV